MRFGSSNRRKWAFSLVMGSAPTLAPVKLGVNRCLQKGAYLQKNQLISIKTLSMDIFQLNKSP